MACCGFSDGTPRPAATALVFIVTGPQGDVGPEWPSFHEARVQQEELGNDFKVDMRRIVLQP